MRFLVICLALATASSQILADNQFVPVPFVAVGRKVFHSSARYQRPEAGINVPLQNIDTAYLMNISIGTPPQPFTMLLDTGSSVTWVPAEGCGRYCGNPPHTLQPLKSNTFKSSNTLFNITYGRGYSRGFFAQDTITLNGAIAVPNANFGVSNANDDELALIGVDGILGISPDVLSRSTNSKNDTIPTIVTTMFDEKVIGRNIFSIYFKPINITAHESRINGEIIFGGVDLDKVENNEITYLPSTVHEEYKGGWTADVNSVTVGNDTVNFDPTIPALVDTGTTFVLLPRNVMNLVLSTVPDLHVDTLGFALVPCNSKDLKPITFNIAGHPFVLYPDENVLPPHAASMTINGTAYCNTYLQEAPSDAGVILGYGFLQQHVSVYDNENNRVGFGRRVK